VQFFVTGTKDSGEHSPQLKWHAVPRFVFISKFIRKFSFTFSNVSHNFSREGKQKKKTKKKCEEEGATRTNPRIRNRKTKSSLKRISYIFSYQYEI